MVCNYAVVRMLKGVLLFNEFTAKIWHCDMSAIVKRIVMRTSLIIMV